MTDQMNREAMQRRMDAAFEKAVAAATFQSDSREALWLAFKAGIIFASDEHMRNLGQTDE